MQNVDISDRISRSLNDGLDIPDLQGTAFLFEYLYLTKRACVERTRAGRIQ